jgi:hypothetical protein
MSPDELAEILDRTGGLHEGRPPTPQEYAGRLIEQLGSAGYAIMRVEPWAGAELHVRGTEARLAIKGYPCTCPRGCMEHPFGPPRAHDGADT